MLLGCVSISFCRLFVQKEMDISTMDYVDNASSRLGSPGARPFKRHTAAAGQVRLTDSTEG
jgi:hypothetical protein